MLSKQFSGLLEKGLADFPGLLMARVGQRLKVPFQMSPAILNVFEMMIHPGPIAGDDPRILIAECVVQFLSLAAAAYPEQREMQRHEDPDPHPLSALSERSFIDAEPGLLTDCLLQFVVGGSQRMGRSSLQLHQPTGAGRHAEHRLEEEFGLSFALPKTGHQNRRQRCQAGTGLTVRGALGQLSTGRGPATEAGQAVSLIFGDGGPDRGQFPDLLPQRLVVAASQFLAASPARLRIKRHQFVDIFERNQLAFVFLVTGLPPSFSLLGGIPRLAGRLRALGVRVLRRRRQRRIVRRHLQPLFQLRNPLLTLSHPLEQIQDHLLSFRRLTSNPVRCDLHARICRRNHSRREDQCSGCERLSSVAMPKNFVKWVTTTVSSILDPEREERVRSITRSINRELKHKKKAFDLAAFKQKYDCDEQELSEAVQSVYNKILAKAWDDRKISNNEEKQLVWIREKLELPEESALSMKTEFAEQQFQAALANA